MTLTSSSTTTSQAPLEKDCIRNQAMSINKVPQCGNLFIGDLSALDDQALLDQHSIIHILSILTKDYCHDKPQFKKYNGLFLQARDTFDQDLKSRFPSTKSFTQNALASSNDNIAEAQNSTSTSPRQKKKKHKKSKSDIKLHSQQNAVFVHCVCHG